MTRKSSPQPLRQAHILAIPWHLSSLSCMHASWKSGAEDLPCVFFREFESANNGTTVALRSRMYQPLPISTSAPHSSRNSLDLSTLNHAIAFPGTAATYGFLHGVSRRWRRERRRRKIGRAYDMALEVAQSIPAGARVLDIGCGSGYIAHHLSGIRNALVTGIDLEPRTEATIRYRQYDGVNFPVEKASIDAALLCYVLHHTQDLRTVLVEIRRVLSHGGIAVIYEDIPACAWDRLMCSLHDLKWRKRTGPCTFRTEEAWRSVFEFHGFEVVTERRLSRWRNLAYPVSRRRYVLRVRNRS